MISAGGLCGDGGEEHVGAGVLGSGDIGGEIGGALREFSGHDSAALGFEGLLKVVAQAAGIVVALLAQGVSGLGLKVIHGKVGQNSTLERIQEANAEIVGIPLGDLGIRAGDADDGNTGVFKGVGTGNGYAGAIRTQHHGAALAHQLGGGGGGLVVGGLIVYNGQLHLIGLAADLHCGLYVMGVLHAQDLLLAAGTVVAGSRAQKYRW